ncbi:MAG: hypothetical protein U1D41_00515 [Nitrosomonas sp.]|uniref:hypothetical protein n=1 Tax=Nitrosomonas sp. TaxID=42353 RepID=UPI0027358A46|nr:hypothetical protein [Nitrosomonas sp.]MDP3662902.1 hypothetical protein [Nitrosomonas sp.]MDZ4104649.1 hypothetical protein [Nitrosomonas sp.]
MTVQIGSVKKPKSTPTKSSTEKANPQLKKPTKKTATKSTDKTVAKPQSLLSDILEARERWLAIIEEKNIGKKVYRNKSSKRGQKKILYSIQPLSEWLTEIKNEFIDLSKKLTKFKKSNKSVSRNLWLPTVIRNAQQVTVRIYEARSDRKVTYEAAKKFAQKAGVSANILNEMAENHEYRISGLTGRQYKIFVSRDTGTKEYPFTEWAICVCPEEELPKLSRKLIHHNPRQDNSKKLICEHNKSKLFAKVKKKP